MIVLPTMEELRNMQDVDIMKADRNELVDIRDITIDETKPVKSRINSYIEAVHNPFLVKAGDYVIKFSYQDSGEEMDERILSYVSQMTKLKC